MKRPVVSLRGIFSARTPLSVLYLLLSFPLGVFYFVFLVVGLTLGFALLIIWVGVPILLSVLAGTWALALLERALATHLLGERLPPMAPPVGPGQSPWQRFKAHVTNRVTWTSALYLLLRFPLGVFTFVLTVTLLSVSLGLFLAPIVYPFTEINLGLWTIDTLPEALIASLVGLVMLPIALVILNAVAALCGSLASAMLGAAELERASGQG